jgi:hypothetical protein
MLIAADNNFTFGGKRTGNKRVIVWIIADGDRQDLIRNYFCIYNKKLKYALQINGWKLAV